MIENKLNYPLKPGYIYYYQYIYGIMKNCLNTPTYISELPTVTLDI